MVGLLISGASIIVVLFYVILVLSTRIAFFID